MLMETLYWGKWGKATTCGKRQPRWPKSGFSFAQRENK